MNEISGYRQLSGPAVVEINRLKADEERLLRKLDELVKTGQVDLRWLAIAQTHFQEGFMALVRSIARPERIKLDLDP